MDRVHDLLLDRVELVSQDEVLEGVCAAESDQAYRPIRHRRGGFERFWTEVDNREAVRQLSVREEEPVGEPLLFADDLTTHSPPHACLAVATGGDGNDPRRVVATEEEGSPVGARCRDSLGQALSRHPALIFGTGHDRQQDWEARATVVMSPVLISCSGYELLDDAE